MKTEISYHKLEGQAKIDKAVQDCKDYVNDDTIWHNVERYCKSCNTLEEVQGGLGMFMGIEGYPAVAMWETYKQDKETDNGREVN